MKIAIAGVGIAGGYLAQLLEQKGLSPDLYDAMDHDTRCGYRSCGWGAPTGIQPYLNEVGLDLNEYLLESMSSMNFDGLVAETPLCTIDKPRFIRDLTCGLSLKHQRLSPEEVDDYDVVVDATGIIRALLPPCRSDLTLPTLQHRVVVKSNGSGRLGAGVFGNQVPGLGYLWIFPLGRDQYHVGVGGIGNIGPEDLMDQFYQDSSGQFTCTILCGCRGSVRVASPYYSTPFHLKKICQDGRSQMIIGVGESIGTVSPFTGEGIVHSLECAKLFAESWPDHEHYSRAVLARFGWMKKERETLDYLLGQGKRSGPRIRDRWRFFRNARRSGIELPLLEAFRRMGSLSRWVDGQRERE